MKCLHCKGEFYPLVHDTFYDNNHKYNEYICPWCDESNFYEVHKKRGHWNKAIIQDRIAELVCMVCSFGIIYYILSHLNKFSTIYR